jgi:4'-phosphopantetheinyl transferase
VTTLAAARPATAVGAPPLENGVVDVWRVPLACAPAEIDVLAGRLAADERARAERFYLERDRARYVAARAGLRAVLARYLDEEPAALALPAGPHGKPELGGSPLRFNASHSRDLALVAVAAGREVGVDVEWIRPVAADSLARALFAPGEAEALAALPAEEREEAFVACWTRKEALVKAAGRGLSVPLDRFEVPVGPVGEPVTVAVPAPAPDGTGWAVVDLHVGPGYAAAVAASGSGWEPRLLELAPLLGPAP